MSQGKKRCYIKFMKVTKCPYKGTTDYISVQLSSHGTRTQTHDCHRINSPTKSPRTWSFSKISKTQWYGWSTAGLRDVLIPRTLLAWEVRETPQQSPCEESRLQTEAKPAHRILRFPVKEQVLPSEKWYFKMPWRSVVKNTCPARTSTAPEPGPGRAGSASRGRRVTSA